MTHISATAFCVWSVMSCALGAFLIGHLWRFDRFKCLRWSNSPYSGAFKRLMTYTYLLTVPLITAYCFGFTYMKYKEGWTITPEGGVVPKPYFLWPDSFQKAIFPLNMVFSFGWSFELITHLEELCFWLFLMNTGSRQPDWFRSPFFRFWAVGSLFALVYVPLITFLYRENPLTCEAHMFLAGSIGDLVLTLAFIPILIKFPSFLLKVKAEGVDTSTMVRLRKFHELNVIRVIFRVLFSAPLLSLGIDGVKGHTHHLNESMFWTDLFIIITALGCAFSSVCTLLIFFPRSYEAEYQAKEASMQRGTQSPRNSRSHSRSGSGADQRSQASRLSVIRVPRGLHLPKRRNTTSPVRRPWMRAEAGVGAGNAGEAGEGRSPQLPMQVPIEMEEQGAGVRYVPRPLPTVPRAQGAGMGMGMGMGAGRKNGAAPTFLLTDSPIAATRRSFPDSGLGVGVLNSAGLETDADPFNPGPSIAVALNPFVGGHPFNPREERAQPTTTNVKNSNINVNSVNGKPTPASIHAPLHVSVHPASYYEGDDKYNEFGYELEYDPWTEREDGDVKVDLDKDLYAQEDTVADLPRVAYSGNGNQSDAVTVPKALSQSQRERMRSRNRAINFSRPMRGGTGSGDNALGLTLENVHRHNVADSDINPIVHSFMSPLDVFERRDSARNTPRNTPRHTPRQSWV